MKKFTFAGFALLLTAAAQSPPIKPPLTLDEFFSFVSISSARLGPDGKSAVIVTSRADWLHNRFRDDLWLWRENENNLRPLTQSGHENDPEWSPDGRYIAFISNRPVEEPSETSKEAPAKEIVRVWLIDPRGGEPFPLYREPLKVHSFAWTSDSKQMLFSTPEPLNKRQQEAEQKQWRDVGRWRDEERGDLLLSIPIANAVPRPVSLLMKEPDPERADPLPPPARIVTRSRYAIEEIAPAPDGSQTAFRTNSISGRVEHPEQDEIYLVNLQDPHERAATRITNNQGLERQLRWDAGSTLYFGVFAGSGNIEGDYRDVQGRLYCLDPQTQKVRRLGSGFKGSWTDFTLTTKNKLLALGQLGTEVQLYEIEGDHLTKLPGKPGSYAGLSSVRESSSYLVQHSAIDEPTELYLVASDLSHARQITKLNELFNQRALPRMKPYRWQTPDGKTAEGVLLYPPGKFEAKNLRMLTLIHGGPEDADGNKFGADWYDWATLAATKGWLVFRPNYRGSTGYGDEFMLEIAPHLVSVPGKDILSGVDALVKDGLADPAHLAIGGYSYGGYMTNWLITQTTRFRSAVTGAGAVEHAANWGNDDLTFDDAWYLGGTPWQKPEIYQSEAALFQFDKVKTPVHDVMGADDVRVSASEGYLLERALDALGIPHRLLIFPGEGHTLAKDPWHGYIKVREELDWLEKYDATAP